MLCPPVRVQQCKVHTILENLRSCSCQNKRLQNWTLKLVCVVSRNFLQSEWCSLEIQLASYRLLDEHRDILLLVFLEHIPESKLSS
ncbi:unnamed protein product [Gadus morhua 'NCC']